MLLWLRQFRRRQQGHTNLQPLRRRPAVEALEDRCVPALGAPMGGISQVTGFTAASSPTDITTGADGNLWVTEFDNNAIARVTPGGTVTEFSLAALGAGNNPFHITSGPNGLLYFTENGTDRIGSINPLAGSDALILASESQSAVVPSGAGAGVDDITAGPDGNLWFTESGVDRVANVDPALTTINEISAGISTGAAPAGIAVGPDGALWFTESGLNKIGRVTTGGTVTEPGTLTGSDPEGITAGPFGTLWFTENGSDQIGRITTGGAVTEFPRLPSASSGPLDITQGPDGNLWFTESDATANRVGRITPAGVVTEYFAGIPANATPDGITQGPDGNLWFAEPGANQVAKLVPDAPLNATSVTASATATVGFSGTVANFTDGDATAAPGDFTVSINWGDGTTSAGTVTAVAGQPGSFAVSGTHTFASAGTNSVMVTITDTNATTSVGGSTAMTTSTVTVAHVGTTTTLTTSDASALAGQPVTLTATVKPVAGSAVPTGTVTFFSGGVPVGSAALNGAGQAVLTTALPTGNAPLTAVYSGSGAQATSTSAAVAENINPDVTSFFSFRVVHTAVINGRFHERLVLANVSRFVAPGPIFLVFRGLTRGRLVNATGSTVHVSPPGTPFFLVATGPLAPGQSRTLNLIFTGSSRPRFLPQVLAGTFVL